MAKLSQTATQLAQALYINEHVLAYVQDMLPKVTSAGMCIYKSLSNPDVYFYCKFHDVTSRGFSYALFQTTQSQMEDLLESRVDILTFEKNATAVYFIMQTREDDPSPSVGFDQAYIGSNNEHYAEIMTEAQIREYDDEFSTSHMYAEADAGYFKVLEAHFA